MSDKIIAPNFGLHWQDVIAEDGTIKDEPIYVRDSKNRTVGLNLEDVQELIDARDAILKAQEEFKNKLPTEPGLYVHPKFVADRDTILSSAAILKLDGDGDWYYLTTFDKATRKTLAQIVAFKKSWGGFAKLRAMAIEEG